MESQAGNAYKISNPKRGEKKAGLGSKGHKMGLVQNRDLENEVAAILPFILVKKFPKTIGYRKHYRSIEREQPNRTI